MEGLAGGGGDDHTGRPGGGNSHLATLERDNHLVVGDEGRLGTVEGDPHALLGACYGDVRWTQELPRSLPPNQPAAWPHHTHAGGRRWCPW